MPISVGDLLLLVVTSSFDAVIRNYPSAVAVVGWVIGMLSYRQDAKYRLGLWAVVSQLFSIICLIALAVFGVTRSEWWNFLLLPFLVWLQAQFTKRWWARPSAWW